MTENSDQHRVFTHEKLTTQRYSGSWFGNTSYKNSRGWELLSDTKNLQDEIFTMRREFGSAGFGSQIFEASSDEKMSVSNDIKQLKEMTCNVLAHSFVLQDFYSGKFGLLAGKTRVKKQVIEKQAHLAHGLSIHLVSLTPCRRDQTLRVHSRTDTNYVLFAASFLG